MKRYFILFLLCAAILKGQDSSFCYQSIEPITEINSVKEISQNLKTESSLILMPVMNENEVVKFMKEKNNSDINKLIKKFRLKKTFRNIGFSAIPEALLGAGFIGIANRTETTGTKTQQNIGVSLIALSAVCLTSSVCFKIVKTKDYKKAIRKYNQLYN